jgi:hypothetical protein
MAVDAPLLTRQRVLAAAVETTTGTVETLLAADAAMNIMDVDLASDIQFSKRQGQGSLSHLPGVPGSTSGTLSCTSEAYGLGSSGNPLWAETFLLACGFSESTQIFTPITGSTSMTTLSLGSYEDGRLRELSGAAGTFTMTASAGLPVTFAFDMTGVWETPTDAAMLTPTYPTVVPPSFKSATLTIGGSAYKIAEVTLAMNNVVALRQDVTKPGAFFSAVIVDRNVTVTCDPESSLLATKDWYADLLAGTEAALSFVVGGTANNIMTIAAPKMQLENVQLADRDGVQTDSLTFQLNRSAAAGDDELSITFS